MVMVKPSALNAGPDIRFVYALTEHSCCRAQGAINRVPWQSTAFSQRGMLYNMQYYIAWTSSDEQQASMAWINGLYSALAAHIAPNSYVNYVDADLPNWASTYYTGALDRLQAIKAKYDPTNFFRFPQSIPLPD